MRLATSAALVLFSASTAMAIDPFRAGKQIERFEVPNVFPCPPNFVVCHGLEYWIKLNEPSCFRWEDIFVSRPDGTRLAVKIEESGTPGFTGYELKVYVDDSGTMLFHISVVDTCPKMG